MAASEHKPGPKPKIAPQPSVFFDIMAEKDNKVRNKKIDELSSGRGSPTTGDMVNILQCLAGSVYIEKKHLRILKKLGEGGFAVVEKAQLSVPGKEPEIVAVKTLKPGLIEDELDLQELIQEANVLRKLKHRYIVDFKGIGSLETASIKHMRNTVFFGEEYMAGGTLKNVLANQMKKRTTLAYRAQDATRWCMQVAQALDYLHHCQPAVVHRDLKPENVLLSSSETSVSEARIADFGLHKRINKVCEAKVRSVRRMTYMGPMPLPGLDESTIYKTQSSVSEPALTSNGSLSAETMGSSKKIVASDGKDGGVPQEATDPYQGWEAPCEIHMTQSGSSTNESPTVGASHLPEQYSELREATSLRSIPEDVPVQDELCSNDWETISLKQYRNASFGARTITLSIPLVVSLDPPWKPPELLVTDDIESQRVLGKENEDFDQCNATFVENSISVWENHMSETALSDGAACPSIPDILTPSYEGKVHGGAIGDHLFIGGSSLLSTSLVAELMSLEPHSSYSKYEGAKVTNHGNDLDGLGDGRNGVDHGFHPINSPIEQDPGAAEKLRQEVHIDNHNNFEGREPEIVAQKATPPPETASAALESIDESAAEIRPLCMATDSIVLAHRHGVHKPGMSDMKNGIEGKQRGSSQMHTLLDNAPQEGDAVSSVMYSLGLPGTANMSGIVGSLMYMAPEVIKGQKYTEKVDVFAFGRIMFELFLGRLLIVKVLSNANTPFEMEHRLEKHAKNIAKGFREEIPSDWPENIRDLISSCWHQDHHKRPRMKEVIARLEELETSGSVKKMDQIFEEQLQQFVKGPRKCCIIC